MHTILEMRLKDVWQLNQDNAGVKESFDYK